MIGWLWCISLLIWLLITYWRCFNLWNTYWSFVVRLRLFLLFHNRLFNQPCHHIYLYIFRRRLLCGTHWIIFRRLLNKLSSLSLLLLLLFILISKRVCVLDYYGLNDSLSSWRGPWEMNRLFNLDVFCSMLHILSARFPVLKISWQHDAAVGCLWLFQLLDKFFGQAWCFFWYKIPFSFWDSMDDYALTWITYWSFTFVLSLKLFFFTSLNFVLSINFLYLFLYFL